jgi:glycosyltransferase involved in cell wall biosynthesis
MEIEPGQLGSIAVVIPAYNEAPTIADVAGRACRYADQVIVVDDGSQDGTAAQVQGLAVTVLRHASNLGKGASLWHGMQAALERSARAVITLDADGQHRPEDIPRLIAAAVRHPDRLIIAARLGRRVGVPRARRFANRVADFWISWAAGYPIKDTQSGFRLYPAALLRELNSAWNPGEGFVFESEILISAARRGYYSASVPIDAVYHERSRRSYYRPMLDTVRITRMVAWKLLTWGLYPQGLLRSLRLLPHERAHLPGERDDGAGVERNAASK